jgi:hypothetical protein
MTTTLRLVKVDPGGLEVEEKVEAFFFVVRWVDFSIFFDIENIVHLMECKNE